MMHPYSWHDGWFGAEHMWGMWIWPVVLTAGVALIVYFALKEKSGPHTK